MVANLAGMKDRPAGVGEWALRDALEKWGIGVVSLEYAPVGFGDYHWIAADAGGPRWFVTVADLTQKGPAGGGESALRRAMDTAVALRAQGLDFVVAPLAAAGGESLQLLGPRYAVSVFPLVSGRPGEFGDRLVAGERRKIVEMLAELHRTTPPPSTPVRPLRVPMRDRLEEAIEASGGVWRGGPYAEPARALVAGCAGKLRERLAEFDRRVDEASGADLVVTHGEPHPGNVVMAEGGPVLVDWDTVGLAPPERDLWLVADGPDDLARYADLTGRRPDPAVMELFRLRWAIEDVALYVEDLRSPHELSADTRAAWEALTGTVRELTDSAPKS
ncbi:phosphotransferase enzyme family protein [Nonomuraea aurantiaca]|uniref:phosphotransferase enzyme family protein n=1 Tax=Nonomuraea aurantiaca TaxID=2878562 RepID=UPI001CDA4708|nr:aminoglycoside phosphotransferase family protein [Nonomuraea aurantiaca]MCA2220432.1 aminoglycoside phosphotransferase family protein [Nonomuraea aurantiaca]